MSELVYLNGDFVPAREAVVSVFDHGFLYGDGIFETMRAYGGRVFQLEEHLERLLQSARILSLSMPLSPADLAGVVRETLRRNNLSEAYLRLSISRGPGPIGLDPRNCPAPTVLCVAREQPGHLEELRQRGVKAMVPRTRRTPPEALDPAAKTCNFLNGIVAKIEANQAGAFEAILLNTRGEVAEGTVSNVFIYRQGTLLTPAAAAGILRGITRDTVLELARSLGLRTEEALFRAEDLYRAEEMFLTNSSWELLPVIELDGRPVGSGFPGAVTRSLWESFRRHVAEVLQKEEALIYERN